MTPEPNTEELRTYLKKKAESLCARSELCELDVIQKLTGWKASPDDVECVMEHLKQNGFVDNRRYAVSFARGKFHQLKWGRTKISYQLRMKRIDPKVIEDALLTITEEEYLDTARKVGEQKWRSLSAYDTYTREGKLSVFMQSKGYESYVIRQVIETLSW